MPEIVQTAFLGVENSVRGRRWQFDADVNPLFPALQSAGYSRVLARLLAARGISANQASEFLNPTLRASMPDPSRLADMDKAASLILDAVEAHQRIFVFADYDVDGGTSAAQLIRWGRAMGVEFGLYVPDRIKEGFGPSVEAFAYLKGKGAELVITVDCGAAAEKALYAAKEMDLPVIVIDHHLMHGDMPPTTALINPNRPDDNSGLENMAAAGVTFMTLVALNREARRRGHQVPDLKAFLDLAALGTICDVVPLTGLNRTLVVQGLKVMDAAPNSGIAALAEISGSKPPFTAYHAGFQLGPRINAGGRIGQADMGARMLSSDDPDLIHAHALRLDKVNAERRAMQDDILREAIDMVESIGNTAPIIVVANTNWHAGVVGVVAGRLKDKYGRPAIVIGVNDEGIGKGSGRSMNGVNLGVAIEQACKDSLLIAGGGHEMAAGLTINANMIDAFHRFLNQSLGPDVEAARKNQTQKIDGVLSAGGATEALITQIDQVGPFGSGNPEPVFVFPNMRITYAKVLNGGGHVRCTLEDEDGQRIEAIAFGAEGNGIADILMDKAAGRVHVLGRVKLNTWNGRRKVDLQVSDLARSQEL